MFNYTPKSQLKVDGKMTSKGADRVGMIQAMALLVAASLFGIAATLGAIAAILKIYH